MIYCPNCKKQLDDDTKFCDDCGTAIPETAAAPVQEEATQTQQSTQQAQPEFSPIPAPAPAKKSPKALIGIICGVVALIVVIFLASGLFSNKNKEADFILYTKDDHQMYLQGSSGKIGPMQITEDNEAEETFNLLLSNGKTLIYRDNSENGDWDVFIRNIKDEKAEPIKIDSGIEIGFDNISENEKTLTYQKDDKVYQFDLTKKDATKRKVASDVTSYHISYDAKTLVYIDDEKKLYRVEIGKTEDKDKETQIAKDVTYVAYIDSKFETVYYVQTDEDDGSMKLSKSVKGKESEKVASDFSKIGKIYEDGQIYYSKLADEENSNKYEIIYRDEKGKETVLSNEADKDFTCADETIAVTYTVTEEAEEGEEDEEGEEGEEPKEPETKTFLALKGTATELKGEDIQLTRFGNDDKYFYYLSDCETDKETYATTGTLNRINVSKKKLGDVENLGEDVYYYGAYDDSESYTYAKDYDQEEDTVTIFLDGKQVDSDVETYSDDYYVDTKTYIYRTDVDKEKGEFTLKIYTGKKADIIDEEVVSANNSEYQYIEEEELVIYYVDYDQTKNEGTLKTYSKGKSQEIDSDVLRHTYDEESKKLYYASDRDSKTGEFTLKVSNGTKKGELIAEEVRRFSISDDGTLFYINDYNNAGTKGTLNRYNGKEPEKVDEDVNSIVPVSSLGRIKNDLEKLIGISYKEALKEPAVENY